MSKATSFEKFYEEYMGYRENGFLRTKYYPRMLQYYLDQKIDPEREYDIHEIPFLYLQRILKSYMKRDPDFSDDSTSAIILHYHGKKIIKEARFGKYIIDYILQYDIQKYMVDKHLQSSKLSQIFSNVSQLRYWKKDRETKYLLSKYNISRYLDLLMFPPDNEKIKKFRSQLMNLDTFSKIKKKLKYKYHRKLNLDLSRNRPTLDEDNLYDRITKSLNYFPYPNMKIPQYFLFMQLQQLERGERLLALSPTGSGKTAVILASVMRHLEEGRRVIIAVRTISQMEVFLREFYKIENNYYILPRIGRDNLCGTKKRDIQQKNRCGNCGKKFGLGLIEELHQEMINAKGSHRHAYIDFMRSQKVCGSYLQKKYLAYSEVVLIPYRFLFEKRWEKLLKKMGTIPENVILLIDEVHNLIDVNYAIYFRYQIYKMELIYPEVGVLRRLRELLQDRNINCDFKVEEGELGEFALALQENENADALNLYQFLEDTELYERRISNGQIYFKPIMYNRMFDKDVYQSIFFSATLYPTYVYDKIFKPSYFHINAFVFNPNIRFYGLTTVDSKHRNRQGMSLKRYSIFIEELVEIARGHVIIIFPSYDMLEMVKDHYKFDLVVRQDSRMDDIKDMIFSHDKLSVATVAGSQIAEGVEFVRDGKSMIRMVIFAGLPYINMRYSANVKLILQRHEVYHRDAEFFLKHVPVFQSVMQGAGRIARSDKDSGEVIILDSRVNEFHFFLRRNKINLPIIFGNHMSAIRNHIQGKKKRKF